MEWNIESSLIALDLIGDCEGTSLWWKMKQGWHSHTLMWYTWVLNRERRLKG